MSRNGLKDPNFWWIEVRHGGMLLSPAILREFLPNGPPEVSQMDYERLRDAYTVYESWVEKHPQRKGSIAGLSRWLDVVLERFLRYSRSLTQKGVAVEERFKTQSPTGERLRPDRVIFYLQSRAKPHFLVKIDRGKHRLGIGKGRAEYSKFLALLRGTGISLGILTNGHQFRLVYAGLDHDSWIEWDATRWFEEENGIFQLAGFFGICGIKAAYTREEGKYSLLSSILESRTRQGELSQVLGEQVRQAIETLLSSLDRAIRAHPAILEPLVIDSISQKKISEPERLDALFQAAVRFIMRIIVGLFAEARELLPRGMESYFGSYGIEGLYRTLEEASRYEGERKLDEMYSAWPRLLSLSRVISEGCPYSDIPILPYGGELFRRGDPTSSNPILRALAVFEDERWKMSDLTILQILRLLKIGKFRIQRGRSSTWVKGPVDFSGLRTEYIGMMYEGVLDYELKQVDDDQIAVIFLNLGPQPALPLSLLESLSDQELKNLIQRLQKEKFDAISEINDLKTSEEVFIDEEEDISEEEPVTEEQKDTFMTSKELLFERALKWTCRAIEVGRLVRKPRGKNAYLDNYLVQVRKKAISLISRIYGTGEMYLVRWGGTRKGSGTYYTKPQLVTPTVHNTLEPLVYDKIEETREFIPKSPETILSLKVVDPAMGSGSFLVAALIYLTNALFESLEYHGKIRKGSWGDCIITLPTGRESEGILQEELLPVPPDDERFESLLKARLKRHIVERGIYGVDNNPLAVELAKLSLWVETMDRELPFKFLDHKLKVGNSLVGCWLDLYQDYPALAWEREGGDKNHTRGVHYKKGQWTKAIKEVKNKRVKPELVDFVQGLRQIRLFEEDELTQEVSKVFEELEMFPIFGEGVHQRERLYHEKILENPRLKELKEAFDMWCAIWFWPADRLGDEAPTPQRFLRPLHETTEIVRLLAREVGFFHWELEFPDVFTKERGGFDAVLGNPPWEISKPNSKEFFTRLDPIYRTYGKQEALRHQERLFQQSQEIERDWLMYSAWFKAMGNWNKWVTFPFGDPEIKEKTKKSFYLGKNSATIHKQWRRKRKNRLGYADPYHPFQYQGSADLNTYKLFLELSYFLLRDDGRMGMIVPSSLYTDEGSTDLRTLFLDNCRWEWIFGFENRKGIFPTHKSFKFCGVVIEKGERTESINTAFMRHDLADWETPEAFAIPYPQDQVRQFSPYYNAILEIQTERDLEIMQEIFNRSILLTDAKKYGWLIKYVREYDMTNDSIHFISKWREDGYKPDSYGRWINPAGEVALPLYEGRMIGQFDFSKKGWVRGKGRSAKWREITFDSKQIEPQFLVPVKTHRTWKKGVHGYRVGFIDVSSATNARTMICCLNRDLPYGNTAPFFNIGPKELIPSLFLTTVFNSFAYDYVLRCRLGGTHLNSFILEETPILLFENVPESAIYKISMSAAGLNCIHNFFAPEWIHLKKLYPGLAEKHWKSWWAITPHERLRLHCILDAIVAELYSLDYETLEWILRDDPSDPKGFWRVDKDKPQELRQTTLILLAFQRLKKVGLNTFSAEDWQFPPEIGDKLGSRFLQWQLEGTAEDSWDECEQHAMNVLGKEGYYEFLSELDKPEFGDKGLQFDEDASRPSTTKIRQGTIMDWVEKQ